MLTLLHKSLVHTLSARIPQLCVSKHRQRSPGISTHLSQPGTGAGGSVSHAACKFLRCGERLWNPCGWGYMPENGSKRHQHNGFSRPT